MTISHDSAISDAQREMRLAYFGGAPGMLTSAAVWFAAGIVSWLVSADRAVWTLLIGGALIHPVSVLLLKAMGRTGKHSSGNPLGLLALATTFWLVLSCVLAYAVSLLHIQWFFPAMLFVIGGRYLTFSTIFGTRTYWVCGATLALAGYALWRINATPGQGAFTGAGIEAAFAIAIFASSGREAVAGSLSQETPAK
jgi:hypothetical protein